MKDIVSRLRDCTPCPSLNMQAADEIEGLRKHNLELVKLLARLDDIGSISRDIVRNITNSMRDQKGL